MLMLVPVTGVTIDVKSDETARLYQSRGFAVPVDPDGGKKDEAKAKAPSKAKKATKK